MNNANKKIEKSMSQKYKSGEISRKEYDNFRKNNPKIKSMWKKYKNGEITEKDYYEYLAKQNGYENYNEYQNTYLHRKNIHLSMSENKECASFLGVHIAERVLSKVFDAVERMPLHNPGFDFICKKGYKIEVKASCLQIRNRWFFNIYKNSIADYFLLLAFDNREDLNPQHIWLIKGEEEIKNKNLNKRMCFAINNTPKIITKYSKYELKDKLDEINHCCNNIKNKEK